MAVRRNQSLNLVLCGYCCCGKTTVGWELARRLRRQFVDVPQEVARRSRPALIQVPRWGKASDPEDQESRLVVDLAGRRDLVVALGPHSLADDFARSETREFSYLVWLDAPFEVLHARMLSSPAHREHAMQLGPEGCFEEYAALCEAYAACDLQLEGSELPTRLAALITHCFYT